ncbi:MAG: terminase family protein [Firmicutes bacterium]|nr:terminase family protein [Bacillota bacterium]
MNKILFRLKQIDDELARRKKHDNLSSYNINPVHQKQMMFHKSPHKNRWVFGGNRSGKTECGAVECVYFARGIHPFRKIEDATDGWVVSVSCEVQRDVAQKKILHYLRPHWIEKVVMKSGAQGAPGYGVIDYILVKNIFGTHSKIGFKSCDQGREKFQGTSLNYVWFDEEPPKDIYYECRMRVLDRAGDIFGTMTPLKGLTFIYDEIYLNSKNDKNIWNVQMEWADNPYLDKFEVENLTKNLSADELNSRRYGKFSSAAGLVYPEFDESLHVIEPFSVPIEWYDNISIDPGLNNPLSCHWYAVDFDGNIYVLAEHYLAQKDVEYHSQIIKEISKSLNWHTDSKGRIEALIDSAANMRTLASSMSVAELFYENGILVNTKVCKDVFSGISRIKGYLKSEKGSAKIFIFKNCVNLIREFKSYWWGKNDSPVKQDDHALDELRYYIMSKPVAHIQKGNKSQITLHKEKLYRKIKR